jgi:hypothetical protein
MALRTAVHKEAAPAAPVDTRIVDTQTADLFEQEEVAAAPAPAVAPVARPLNPARPAPAPQTAVVPSAPTAVAQFRPLAAYNEFKDVMDAATVETLGVGAFGRVTVDLGGFVLDKTPLGSLIRLSLYSWNYRYMVVTGADGEEAKKMVRISYDGVTCSGTGEDVKDVLESFREAGYSKASIKTYVDLYGSLVFQNDKDVPEDEQLFVQVQLSPESVKKWKAFQVETSFKAARGAVQPSEVITLRAQRGEWNSNRYGYCIFSLK